MRFRGPVKGKGPLCDAALVRDEHERIIEGRVQAVCGRPFAHVSRSIGRQWPNPNARFAHRYQVQKIHIGRRTEAVRRHVLKGANDAVHRVIDQRAASRTGRLLSIAS